MRKLRFLSIAIPHGFYLELQDVSGIFMHRDEHIEKLLQDSGFVYQKELKFLVKGWLENGGDFISKAYVVQKSGI
jgi:hypothetical protein